MCVYNKKNTCSVHADDNIEKREAPAGPSMPRRDAESPLMSILCVSARSGAPERHFESRKRRLNPKFMKCHQIPRTSSRLSSAPSVTRATPLRPCERKYNSTSRTTCPIQTLQKDPEHNVIENKKEYIIMGARCGQSHLHRYYSPAVQNLLYELLLSSSTEFATSGKPPTRLPLGELVEQVC